MPFPVSDPVGNVLRNALDGLAVQQRVTANNLANVDTPDFIATKVDFEGPLRAAMADGSIAGGDVAPVTEASTDQVGANGNNVDVASETMTAMQATFQYQLLSRAVGDRFGLISTAIGAGA
ncbi:MAG: flagellar basal body rod protein FlgB [Nocardioidaceae bacterium]